MGFYSDPTCLAEVSGISCDLSGVSIDNHNSRNNPTRRSFAV